MRVFYSSRWPRLLQVSRVVLVVSMILAGFHPPAHAEGRERPVKTQTSYRTIKVDGLSIFYREAGPKDAPTLLLLHGLPSSSRMFEPLYSRLSDHFHLVAPDYPGFGHSDWPDPKKFAYTFDHIAETMNHFTEALGLSRYTLYMQDYGGPVGFRMALAHPDRIERLIIQVFAALARFAAAISVFKSAEVARALASSTKPRSRYAHARLALASRLFREARFRWSISLIRQPSDAHSNA